MKLKQLLCLGALMTLPMSMSANLAHKTWETHLIKMNETEPGSSLCVTNYYVESPKLLNIDTRYHLHQMLTRELNNGKEKTVSIEIAKAYPYTRPVFVIEHTFNSTHNYDCVALQNKFKHVIKSTIAEFGFNPADVPWFTREIIFKHMVTKS